MLEPEKRRISQEVAAILESADTQSAESLSAVQAEGLQSSFCDYWPQAKKALEFLSQFVPQKYKDIIARIIKAGDFLFGQICG